MLLLNLLYTPLKRMKISPSGTYLVPILAKFTLSPVAGNDKQAELKVKAYTTTSTLPAFSSTASENIFNIVVSAKDGSGNTSDQSIAINLLEADAPQITGPNSSTGANSTISISESTTQVHKFVADEPFLGQLMVTMQASFQLMLQETYH